MKPEKPKRFDINIRSYKNDYGKYQQEIERDYCPNGEYYDAYDMDAYIEILEQELEKIRLRNITTPPTNSWWC